jgi:PPOX class probable F420-dependent enzyme
MPRAQVLSPAAVKMLQEKQLGQLSTIMADGSPQVTPVWVDVEDDGSCVLVNTVVGRLKAKNTARDPRVALSVVDSQNWQRFVIVRGKIVDQTPEGADAHIEKLAWKYLGKAFHHPGDERLILRIRPEWVMERHV